jgi:hypothetical protein
MCVVTILAALVTVSCPDKVPPADAARILANAPGLSNRTNVYPLPDPPRVPFLPSHTSPTPQNIESRRLDGTPVSEPPQVYGIPYPWTPLTWAILHSGGAQFPRRR